MTRVKKADLTTAADCDWSLLEDSAVESAIAGAAKWMAPKTEGVYQPDDLHQEAAIIVASNPDEVRRLLGDEFTDQWGNRPLCRWIIGKLRNATQTEMARAGKSIPLHVFAERAGE